MPLPVSASDVTETVKNAAQANGSVAQAVRAAAGGPVKASRSAAISSRPASAIASIVKSSSVARSIGFAPPVSSGSSAPRVGVVSAHTGALSIITASGVNYDLYTFLNTGTNTFVVSDLPIVVDIFVLGGGGGGAGAPGGRGGSFTVASNITLAPQSYSLTVGAGGTGNSFVSGGGTSGGASSITVSGTTYTGAGGSLGGGTGANGPTSDFTGVVTNYGGQGATTAFGSWTAGGLGGGGASAPSNDFFAGGGAGTDGLGGGGGGNRSDSEGRSGRGGHGRVMIRVRR